jgi:catechol 2,3-dioxygenase-like lactoylglutathione lyase family enzyme
MEIRETRVVLRARDFDRTLHFYGETLALPRLRSWDREDGRAASFLAGHLVVEILGRPRGELGDLRDEVYDFRGPSQKLSLTFVVPSAERAYEELFSRDRNLPGGLRQDVDGTLLFETRDPDGVRIVFRQADGR